MNDTQIAPQVFAFEGNSIHIIMENGEPLFRANDVCGILGYSNPHDAIKKHVREKHLAKREGLSATGMKSTNYLLEPGLWSLLSRSNQPAAEPFQDWLFEEVLPTIRKTGSYSIPRPAPQPKKLPDTNRKKLRKLVEMCVDILLDAPVEEPRQHPETVEELLTRFREAHFRYSFPHDFWTGNARKLVKTLKSLGIETGLSTKSIGRGLAQLATRGEGVRIHQWDKKRGNAYQIFQIN